MRSAREGLEALHAELLAGGGALAEALVDPPAAGFDEPGPAQIAAAGPRALGAPAEYELLVEMIFEGSCLHYGDPRIVQPSDPDLRLLLGDQLYALGLQRLAVLGDLDAVRALADVISLVAQAHAEHRPERLAAVWAAGAAAVGWGPADGHQEAAALALPAAASAVGAAAHRDGR